MTGSGRTWCMVLPEPAAQNADPAHMYSEISCLEETRTGADSAGILGRAFNPGVCGCPAWLALPCGHGLILADSRREWVLGDHGRRAASVPGAAAACPQGHVPAVPDNAAVCLARRRAGRRGAGSPGRGEGRWAVGGLALGCRGSRLLGVRRGGQVVVAESVTVRDSKRCAGPLAVPRPCPLYVRDHGISRTHDRVL